MDGHLTATASRLHGVSDSTLRWLGLWPSARRAEVIDRLAADPEVAKLVAGILASGRSASRAELPDEINAVWERALGRMQADGDALCGESAATALVGRLVSTAKFVRLEAIGARRGTAGAHHRAVTAAMQATQWDDLHFDGGHEAVLEKLGAPARRHELDRLVGNLAQAQKQVIRGRYGLGLRPGDNASQLGISALAESKRHASAIAAVRRSDTRTLASMRLHPASIVAAVAAARQALLAGLEATGSAIAISAAAGALAISGGVALDLVPAPHAPRTEVHARSVVPTPKAPRRVAIAATPTPTPRPAIRRLPKPRAATRPTAPAPVATTRPEVRRRTTNEFEVGRPSTAAAVPTTTPTPRVTPAPRQGAAAGQEFEVGGP
jgi:hypothetical protein